MTDLDERLRAAGEAFRDQPVPDLDLHWPKEKHEHRWLAPLAVAAAVALVIGGVLAVKSWHHDAAVPPAKPSPAAPVQPDRNFAVALPLLPLASGHGAAYLGPPTTCLPSNLHASAVTSAANDGVVGVITMVGTDCTLNPNPVSLRLLDAGGKGLSVPVDTRHTGSLGWPFVADQSVRVGFAWTGAYCGTQAAAVEIEISGKPLRVPLRGPAPKCRARAVSRLMTGNAGGAKVAVVPPPIAWKPLRAALVLPKSLPWDQPFAVEVILTNTGRSDVSLASPCASWQAALQVANAGGLLTTGSSGDFCSTGLVVKPGHPLHLSLGTLPLDDSSAEVRGSTVTVAWGISGVPTATAKSVIQ